jgi:hypothetical protein
LARCAGTLSYRRHRLRVMCRLHRPAQMSASPHEHRPLLLGRFPGWESRIESCHIDDVEVRHRHSRLAQLPINSPHC